MLQLLRRREPAPPAQASLIRSVLVEAMRRRLALDDDAVIRAAEVGCADPGCADFETIVVLMRPGRPSEAVKAQKPMRSLDGADVEDLALQLAAKCGITFETCR